MRSVCESVRVVARYVIDPGTLLRLVSGGREVLPGIQLVAPNRIRSEALELLLDRVRAGVLTEQEASTAHTRLTALKMRLLGDRVSRATAFELAREHDWENLRNAEYLAVARLQADALVAEDAVLRSSARGVVPVAPFEVLFRP